jgi:hypothetical protein
VNYNRFPGVCTVILSPELPRALKLLSGGAALRFIPFDLVMSSISSLLYHRGHLS